MNHTEPPSSNPNGPDLLWNLKIGAFLSWTALMGLLWFMMASNLVGHEPVPGTTPESNSAAQGLALVMLTGCTGGAWVVGVIVLLLVYAIFRR